MIDPLPAELLEQAGLLLSLPENQANLRRSISTCYYALFNLLIRDAIALWKVPDHRYRLARQFEHRRMKEASSVFVKSLTKELTKLKSPSREYEVVDRLFTTTNSLVTLQQSRHDADYDLSAPITREAAQTIHITTRFAFDC
jgi:hypothetical protein